MTRLFFDTEFTGLHQNTTLISIGIYEPISGKYFYAECTDYDKKQMNDWIQENVIKNLKYPLPEEGEGDYYIASRHENNPVGNNLYNSYSVQMQGELWSIKEDLIIWLSQFDEVEFWSDCLAYDWVLFNNIFGHAFRIPTNVYYIPFDICTAFKLKSIDPDISREGFVKEQFNSETWEKLEKANVKHNSLWDAIIISLCYDGIMNGDGVNNFEEALKVLSEGYKEE